MPNLRLLRALFCSKTPFVDRDCTTGITSFSNMQTTRERRKPKDGAGNGVSSAPPSAPPTPQVATVRRRKWGTSAFDDNWLNVDCCGLVCAVLTYCLHCYGVFAVCFILIPPWMSSATTVENEIRSISIFGHLHRLAFALVAVLACAAHFKAMTTDPGAVPPDATPLELEKEGEEESCELIISPTQKGKRLCRRCRAFKPQRAHHCR